VAAKVHITGRHWGGVRPKEFAGAERTNDQSPDGWCENKSRSLFVVRRQEFLFFDDDFKIYCTGRLDDNVLISVT